ncbi:unnamed protein product [Pleuronectes platessa]|uniref:Uncharacterized protein n=1 Tax=Pleuronectes platessa TaxID=8262 RepID=A0A9N7TKY5_PLEPL|nr:unnamed protein product [Pleuronectes platessa]
MDPCFFLVGLWAMPTSYHSAEFLPRPLSHSMLCTEWRWQPMIRSAVFTTLCRALRSAAEQLPYQAVVQPERMSGPGQVILDEHTKEFEVGDSLHYSSVDVTGIVTPAAS